ECDPFCINSGRWNVISGHEYASNPFLNFPLSRLLQNARLTLESCREFYQLSVDVKN
ncbi:hypothetical protein KI387_012947, partial [Taxus chinensis]